MDFQLIFPNKKEKNNYIGYMECAFLTWNFSPHNIKIWLIQKLSLDIALFEILKIPEKSEILELAL